MSKTMLMAASTRPSLYFPVIGVDAIPPRKAWAGPSNGLDTPVIECWLSGQTSQTDSGVNIPSMDSKFRAVEIGIPDRLRSGDLLHERQACELDYTTGTEMVK